MKKSLLFIFFLVPAFGYLTYAVLSAQPEFSATRLAGAPVLAEQGARPSVVFLTTHEEFPADIQFFRPIKSVHVDLWAFAADELTPLWVQRVYSRRYWRRSAIASSYDNTVSYRIVGIEDGTVWLLVDRLYAVALADGTRMADAVEIEARNPPLVGKLHIPRALLPAGFSVTFEAGLEVQLPDGTQWRIDSKTLLAQPAETGRADARRANALSWPMRGDWEQQALKARGVLIGETWYGMADASEDAASLARGALEPGLADQDFRKNLSYQLWSARVVTRPHPHFPGQSVKRAEGFAPVPASPSFLQGGLLAARMHDSSDQLLTAANPTRLLVLHQNRAGEAARQTLSCLRLDGTSCWEAKLDLSIASTAASLPPTPGRLADGAIILAGRLIPLDASGTQRAPDRDIDDVIVQVALKDGSLKRIDLGALDVRTLQARLVKSR